MLQLNIQDSISAWLFSSHENSTFGTHAFSVAGPTVWQMIRNWSSAGSSCWPWTI